MKRGEFTDEQVERAKEMVAHDLTTGEIARQLGLTWGRANTLTNRLDVMDAAHRLRTTTMIPEALDRLLTTTAALLDVAQNVESRQTALEREMRGMRKAIHLEKLRITSLRERNQSLREQVKEMRDLLRRRGLGHG